MNTDSVARALAIAALGDTSYEEIINKPRINNVEVSGRKSGTDYDLQNKINANNKISVNFIEGILGIDGLSNYYNKNDIEDMISSLVKARIQIVNVLPAIGDTNVIYFVPKSSASSDTYDEYIYINNNWEQIGNTDVDLSNYYTKTEANVLLNNKQDSLNSGNGVAINTDNELSVKVDGSTIGFNSNGQLQINDSNVQKTDQKVQSITISSTHNEYPTAKAVYDLFTTIVDADEERY